MAASKDPRLASLDSLFKALADPTRLRILGILAAGEICVCDIHDSLGIPQPRTSRHLSYLRRAGLVRTRKDGLWVHYRLAALDDRLMNTLLTAVTHCLGHVDLVTRDRQRLESRTGCAIGSTTGHPMFECCRPPRQSSSDRRRDADRRAKPRHAR
jgi:ArsR family transcriptional regulator, arsenate/arsenite/antimonite-responsive transcriptional repressor